MLAQYQSNGADFTHVNPLGSETQNTDYAGNGGQAILYYPWGQVWQNPSGGYPNSFYQIFASLQLYDTSTDGYVPPFRYYIPEQSRWLTPDLLAGDIMNPQSLNRYAYVLNNPATLIDPLGLGQCLPGTPGYESDCPKQPPPRPDQGVNDAVSAPSSGCSLSQGLTVINLSGCPTDVGRPSPTKPPAPKTKINLCKALQRGRLVAQAGLSIGVGIVKVQAAVDAAAAVPVTGGASAVGTAYLGIGASGNFTASGIQLQGAITGDINAADQGAALVTTATTATGLIALGVSGNPETAAKWAGIESLATTGVNGGMTGHLIDEGLTGAARLLQATDIGQNILDLLGVDAGCGGG